MEVLTVCRFPHVAILVGVVLELLQVDLLHLAPVCPLPLALHRSHGRPARVDRRLVFVDYTAFWLLRGFGRWRLGLAQVATSRLGMAWPGRCGLGVGRPGLDGLGVGWPALAGFRLGLRGPGWWGFVLRASFWSLFLRLFLLFLLLLLRLLLVFRLLV